MTSACCHTPASKCPFQLLEIKAKLKIAFFSCSWPWPSQGRSTPSVSSNLSISQDAYEYLHNAWTIMNPQIKISILVQRLKSCQLKTDKQKKSKINQDVLPGTSPRVCKSGASATANIWKKKQTTPDKHPGTGEKEGKTLGKSNPPCFMYPR